ncbi:MULTISPECIES: DNA recombination protein RmuC [Commensalibacter]|uniref:DNA recombination protein RmuC n=1 Tax=Commensalibacter TaxID=1079922 RepID=UPI0012D8DDB6|nr:MULTISPECIES: DNA recombination protein RmuC [Commensalibacter]MCT6851499.1 DNA recombination protein RmuC [Commensalibacter sp.]MBH9969171.1 DNA recombination protein RmuC [Commensalibacter sp. M0265]MBH9976526.1 DNA recombination protein RmuC [Commensalibacter sp. M0266]MBH9992537.1 DNA recombination protein RmuC [Commensalibacter sp. M0270]MBI0045702.1 DNA recombination protein RmuC [Commensalibacter sp. M0267]
MISNYTEYFFIFIIVLIGFGLAAVFILKQSIKKNDRQEDILKRITFLIEKESSARIQDQDRQQQHLDKIEKELFDRLQNGQNQLAERLHVMNESLMKEQSTLRLDQARAMQLLTEQSSQNLTELRQSVTERLNKAVETQMQSSFQRVVEQFSEIQKLMGEVNSVTAQMSDLKRLFTNVKTRGGWGEAQLQSILDDILPTGTYERNVRLKDNSMEIVEFAVHMPAQGSHKPLMAIDSKFPTEAYERLIQAIEEGNSGAEQAARKALESCVKQEAKKIASKYIVPPKTVEFAVLYVPTDGLYTEIARIPGLIDEIGRVYHILIMSPALMPPLLRTIHLGYVSLALSEKTEFVSSLLGKTRQEMIKIDMIFEKLTRYIENTATSVTDARRKTQKLIQSLEKIGEKETE